MGFVGYHYGSELSKQFEHGQIMDFMEQASALTALNAPNTIPKAARELQSTLMHSVLAVHVYCDEYSLVGHVTASQLFDGFVYEFEDERSPIYRPPVLKVGSLIVDEAFQGEGIATKLLSMLVKKLQPETLQTQTPPTRKNWGRRMPYLPADLVTVSACPDRFKENGFFYGTQSLAVPNKPWQQRVAKAKVEDKWVMSKLVKEVHGYNVMHNAGGGR